MSLLLFFISLLFVSSPITEDTSFVERTKQQADFFIHEIEQQPENALPLWALAMLQQSSPDASELITEQVAASNIPNDLAAHFTTAQSAGQLFKSLALETGSPNLLFAALLQAEETQRQNLLAEFTNQHNLSGNTTPDYHKLAQHIVNGERIDSELLSVDQAPLIHFLLFYEGTNFVASTHWQTYTDYWNSVNLNSIPASIERSIIMGALIMSNFMMEQHQQNLDIFSLLIEDELLPNSTYRLNLYRALDYSVYSLGYYDRSLTISRTFTVPLSGYLGRTETRLTSLMEQATSLYRIGKIKESQRINLNVLEEAEENDIEISQSYLLNNLGITYLKSGEFDRYLDLQFQSLEIAREENRFTNELNILRNLHVYYKNFNEIESAEYYLEEAKELALTHGEQEELSKIYITTGVFQRDLNQNYELATDNFQKAESIIDPESDHQRYVRLLFEQAELLVDTENYSEAFQLFDKVKKLTLDKEDSPNYLDALVEQVRIHLFDGNVEAAGSILEEIDKESLDQLDFEEIIKAKTVEADFLKRTGETGRAYDILKPTLEEVVNRARSSTNLESGFWNIESEFLDAFELMTNLLLETGQHREAVETLDQLKTINDPALYQNPMVKSSLLNERELTLYNRLSNELDSLRKKKLVASGNEASSITNRINQLNSQKRTLDLKISKLADKSSVSTKEVQQQLTGNDLVLHITELNNWFYIANITKRNVTFDKVEIDSTTQALFNNAINNVSTAKTDLNQLSEITEILNLRNLPSHINKIIVIPDSYFYEMPIDILPLNIPQRNYNFGEATYTAERFNTHYITTINDFAESSEEQSQHKWDFVGYGVSDFNAYQNQELVSLPYASSEINNITNNLHNLESRTGFINTSSSEAKFKATAPLAKILHLATHSELSEQDPLYSTIYMSPDSLASDQEFPGQIFAYELFELNLDSELIMLNSCESGSGPYLQGAGVRGISRALRYAGAKALILNLWSVNDMMASEFAIEFYKHINEGESKSEALRLTKLHFIKDKNADPHYWGPYMLIGDPSPIIEPDQSTNIYLAASFMAYFLILATLSLTLTGRIPKFNGGRQNTKTKG